MTHVLLVCTGNICRSPLAEALLRREVAARHLEVEVSSAGTGAWDGAPASEGAYLVGLEHDLDLSAHRARMLTRDVIKRADLILTMAHGSRNSTPGRGSTCWVSMLAAPATTPRSPTHSGRTSRPTGRRSRSWMN
jgi:protein-tyrosine-phosphatase